MICKFKSKLFHCNELCNINNIFCNNHKDSYNIKSNTLIYYTIKLSCKDFNFKHTYEFSLNQIKYKIYIFKLFSRDFIEDYLSNEYLSNDDKENIYDAYIESYISEIFKIEKMKKNKINIEYNDDKLVNFDSISNKGIIFFGDDMEIKLNGIRLLENIKLKNGNLLIIRKYKI